MKFIDFFAGIGGMRLGLEQAHHERLGFVEMDEHAVKSYIAMHGASDEWYHDDITTLQADSIPDADLWCGGFPCQDVSVAGKRKGLDGERSGLFFEFCRILKGKDAESRPRYILLENVRYLLSVNGGWDFARVLSALDECGYDCQWQVINSARYVPQQRKRVFIVGHLRGTSRREIFPIRGTGFSDLKQVIGGMQGYRVYDPSGSSPAMCANAGGLGAKSGLYLIGSRIRRLTPREQFRLQGFPDDYYDRAAEVCSEAQLYKQSGNAVTVPVARAIGERLKEIEEQQ